MDITALIYDLFTLVGHFPGGTPAFMFSVMGAVFFGMAAYKIYRQYAPKIQIPKKPKSPPAPPGAEQEPGQAGAPEAEPGAGKSWDLLRRFHRPQPKIKLRRVSLPLLRQSFKHQTDAFREHTGDADALYRTPWFMLLGEAGAGKSTLLAHTELPQPLPPPPYADPAHPKGCDWWFYEQGVVLDVAGDMVAYRDAQDPEHDYADERGWGALLQLLLKYRARRPIDGVVLALPVTDLLGPQGLDTEALQRKAGMLYQRLAEAQRVLGMRFPVYVLISKCDRVPGFRSFCRLLPEHLRQNIFGWSNPYSLETIYNNGLVDQAFQKIYRDLNELQLELVTAAEGPVKDDGFLLFPHELRAVFKQLRVYLENVFKASVHHEPFMFRGIYFCGDAGGGEGGLGEGPAAAADASDTLAFAPGTEEGGQIDYRPIFLSHLFAEKIFAEANLARPVYRTFKTRNKVLWATQAGIVGVALAGAGSQWWAFREVRRETESLLPVLHKIAENSQKLRELKLNIRFDKTYFAELNRQQRDSATELLRGLGEIEGDGLASPLAPSSLFSTVDKHVAEALTVAYDRFVLKWLYNGLHRRAKEVVYLSSEDEDTSAGEALEELPEFLGLRRYVGQLNELQEYSALYNRLKASRQQNQDLGRLVGYLYQMDLPGGFYAHARGFYVSALNTAEYTPFALELYGKPAQTRFDQLRETLFRRLFEDNTLLAQVRQLGEELAQLQETTEHVEWFDILSQLNDSIEQIQALLQEPAVAWAISPNFDLGGEFSSLLADIKAFSLFGEKIHDATRETAKTSFARLREELQSYTSDLTGPLLLPRAEARKAAKQKKTSADSGEAAQQREQELVLAPAVLRLKKTLDGFLAQKFMAEIPEPRELQTALPDNKRLLWDIGKLREAVDLTQSFQSFVDKDLGRFPEALQEIAKQAGHFQLHANLVELVAQAQKIETRARAAGVEFEKGLRAEVENFKQAGPILGWLLDVLDLLKEAGSYPEQFAATHEELQALGVIQAHRLLGQVNQLLEQDDLYSPREVDYFAGLGLGNSLSQVAFAVNDKEELNYYLSVQRDRIHFLAQTYVQPLLEFIGDRPVPPGYADSEVIPRWTRIYQELYKYDSEKPDNSLSVLENYILFELDKLSLENCYSQLYDNAFGTQTGDYFLQKRAALQQRLFEQCQSRQRFISAEAPAQDLLTLKTDLPLERALFWDIEQLQEAVAQGERFGKFVEEELPRLPKEQQASAKDQGYAAFHAKLIDQVARAQVFDTHLWERGVPLEKGLRDEIQNFAEASPLLDWLLNFLKTAAESDNRHQDKFSASRRALETLGITQAHHLLTFSDRLLQEDKLYSVRNAKFFEERAGGEPLSFVAFNTHNQEELLHYVTSQRNRVHLLAQDFAQPLLNFLGGRDLPPRFGTSGVMPRWVGIYTELQKYDNGNPENSVSKLEEFIQFGMDKVRLENCYSELYQRDLGSGQGDYFLARRASLQNLVFQRCHLVQRPSARPGEAETPTIETPSARLESKLLQSRYLAWDIPKLREAVDLAQAFGKFIDEEAPKLTPAQRQVVDTQGFVQFHNNLVDLLAAAQKPGEKLEEQRGPHLEQALSRDIENFNQAGPMLDWLLDFLDLSAKHDTPHREELAKTRSVLQNLGLGQSYRLLTQVDRLLDGDDLYRPPNPDYFAQWDGTQTLWQLAFGVKDKEELQHYLAVQRNRVHYLAEKYAQPLLRFLGGKPIPPQYSYSNAVPRWTRIYNELFKYDAAKPDNSVTYLENFIGQDLGRITLGNCYTELYREGLGKSSGDYFLQKRAELHGKLFQQCQFLADLEAYRRYHVIEDFFNQKLAGRFPFAPVPEGTFFSEAAPQDLQDFFQIYRTYGENLIDFLGMSRTFGNSRDPAIQFLDQIERVRLFLSPLLDQPLPANAPLFDLIVDFRVNQGRETEANQIIDWSLEKTTKGLNFFTQGHPVRPAKPQLVGEREGSWHFSDRWSLGDAFRFSLRWARNSAFRPYWDGRTRGFSIAGNDDTAVFEFRGQWALLEMILKHMGGAGDFDRLEDAEPHTLKFTVPTRRLLAARRAPPPAPETETPPPPKRLPEKPPQECYMDWYEEAYGDKRCLEQGYTRIPGSDEVQVQTPDSPPQLDTYKLSQQDMPYPARETLRGAALGEVPLGEYTSRYSDEFQDTSAAKLFIRVTLTHADKKEALVVPVFPAQAPVLTGMPDNLAAYDKKLATYKTLSSPLPPPEAFAAPPAPQAAGATAQAAEPLAPPFPTEPAAAQ